MFKKYFSLLVLIVVLYFNLTFAAKNKKPLTPEQQALKNKLKAERIKKSEAADKKIHHSTIKEFKKNVLTDTENLWVVFYGSKKCPHTQRFNPKWLQFQENMESGLYHLNNVKLTKIECYGEQFDFCMSQNNQYWPELMFYYKGVKKAAYDGEDEIEDIVKYIKNKKSVFMKETAKTTKSVKQVKSSSSSKQLPKKVTNQKTKQPPPKRVTNNQTKQPSNQTAKKLTKRPPNQYKQINTEKLQTVRPKGPVPVTAKPTKNIVENNIDNNIETDNDINNAIEDDDNDVNNAIEDDDIITDNKDSNIKDSDFIDDEPEQESSHTFAYSVGGCAAFVACFFFVKKRFKGHGYSRISDARMKYKHIV